MESTSKPRRLLKLLTENVPGAYDCYGAMLVEDQLEKKYGDEDRDYVIRMRT